MEEKKSSKSRLRSFCGTPQKPLQVLVDRNVAEEFAGFDTASTLCVGWKAAFNMLMYEFGFGTVAHNITPSEYSAVYADLEMEEKHGDVRTGLRARHVPVEMDVAYRGPRTEPYLVRLGKRKDENETLESLVVAHQFLLSCVLERGIVEDVHGEQWAKVELSKHPLVMTSAVCRFKIRIPPLSGMVDYVRVLDQDLFSVDVGTERVFCLRRSKASPCVDCQFGRANGHGTCESHANENGGFVSNNMDKVGIYVTITEEVVRGSTGGKGERGLYYEYVGPLNAMEPRECRTLFMTIGSSIVVPSTFAVRFGAHEEHAVQVFGYLLRARRTDGKRMSYMKREDLELYDDLEEYGAPMELVENLHDVRGLETVDWNSFGRAYPKGREGVVGTIPSVLDVEMTTSFRKRLIETVHKAVPSGMNISEIYKANPVSKLVKYDENVRYRDDRDAYERRLWLGDGDEWMFDGVPYKYIESSLQMKLIFPFDLTDIQEAVQQQIAMTIIEEAEGSDGSERDEAAESESAVSESENESAGQKGEEKGTEMACKNNEDSHDGSCKDHPSEKEEERREKIELGPVTDDGSVHKADMEAAANEKIIGEDDEDSEKEGEVKGESKPELGNKSKTSK
ncbi:hypothetical protein FGB62_405g011 [Gracilaria domingensis]|nr:hypothetical protein FGB62_405g011 [Gracilaria domingensis]